MIHVYGLTKPTCIFLKITLSLLTYKLHNDHPLLGQARLLDPTDWIVYLSSIVFKHVGTSVAS